MQECLAEIERLQEEKAFRGMKELGQKMRGEHEKYWYKALSGSGRMDDYQCLGCFEMFKGDSLPAVNHHLDVCPKCRADLERGRRSEKGEKTMDEKCPFCAGDPVRENLDEDGAKVWFGCPTCQIGIANVSSIEARLAWNRRSDIERRRCLG